jgi:membrane protein implicated in regulation of membrane protease activity
MMLATWFDNLFTEFSDATFYFVLAAVGTGLFLIRFILMLFAGVDGDFDVDADAHGFEFHGTDFSLFSMFSILSFMMGAGWMGLAARVEWGLPAVQSAIYAALFGFFLMMLSSFGLWQMRKLSKPARSDPRDAIGMVGTVYMRVPARGEGRGQIQVNVGGTRKTVDAVSSGPPIDSFEAVRVLDVREDGALVVEKT